MYLKILKEKGRCLLIKEKKIYLSSPHMSDEGYEMEYIKEAFE